MEQSLRKKMWAYSVIGMLTTIVVLAFARLSYGVVLPFMREGLDISYKQAGYLGTTSSLGYLCTVMFAGILSAKWGGKKTILLGISVVTMGLAGLSVTPSYPLTFMFMLLLGVGTAFTYTPLISLLVGWFPSHRGFVIGITTSGVGIGLLLSGMIVPYFASLSTGIGWRFSWGLFAAVSLAVTLVTFFFIKDPPSDPAAANMRQKASTYEVYRNPKVILIGVIYGIVGITYIVQAIFVMSFMIDSGLETKVAGRLMAANGILSIFSGPIWGLISDRIGRRTALIFTMGLTAFSMIIPVFLPTLLGFTLHIVLLSCTVTGLFTLVQASSMDNVKPSEMPIAFGYATFYFALGQFIGPAIAGWLIEDFGGFKSAFIFSSLCLAVGLLLALKIKKPAGQQTSFAQAEA